MSNTNTILKNEQIQAQIGEKEIEAKKSQQTTGNVLAKRRTPRAGLGSQGEKDDSSDLTIEEMKIKRKLMQKEKRVNEQLKEDATRKHSKRYMNASPLNSDEDDEESVRRKGQKKVKKNAQSPFLSIKDKKSPNILHKGFGR